MQNNQILGFRILETIKNERSIQTLKVKFHNNKTCIAKNYNQSYCIQVDDQITFMKNLDTIFKLKYPSILPLDGYLLHNYEKILYPIIYTQYLPKGSLEDLLKTLRQNTKINRFNWTQTDNYITLLGISLGLNYLHSKGIVHYNLKPSNILFDNNYHPMICDIDVYNQRPTTFSKSYDICKFAQIIYELITDKSPPIQIDEIPDLDVQAFIIRCISDKYEKVPTSEEVLDFILKKPFKDLFGTINMDKVIQYLNFCHENETDGEDFTVHGMFLYEDEKEKAAELFKRGAERGSAKCAFIYASMITKEVIKVDYKKEEVIQYYEKAIEKGNVTGMYDCACYIIQNFQSKEYIDKANDYFKMAAERGHVLASYQYGLILLDLNQKKEAAHFFKEAADKGNVNSMFYYAKLLKKGDGIDPNKEEAISYYLKAIEHDDINSMNNYAKIIMNSNKDEEKRLAVSYFKIAAEKGNDCAMCNYAYMCQVGQGIKQNLEMAKALYSQSIKKGNPKAMNLYGRMLELDCNDDKNIKKAGYLYKKAAEKGNVKAMNNLFSLIEKGNKIEINIDDEIRYSKTAAIKGKLDSMVFYACMLYEGKKITMNKDEAKSYFHKAIKKGSIDAMLYYGHYLELENNIECIDLYKMAAKKGSVEVIHHLITIIKKNKNIFNDTEKVYYYKLSADKGNAYAMYKYGSIQSKKENWYEAAKYFCKAIKTFQNKKSLTDDSKIYYEKALNCYMCLLEEQKIVPISQFQEDNTEIFKIAANFENLYAMVQYGLRLKDGIGTEMDEDKAFYYIKKAADAGYLLGIHNYARFLELGIGTEINLEEAKDYYKIAIENGSIDSVCYYSSLVNSHFPDLADEALYYLKEAAEKGHNEAMYMYASKFVNDQEEKLFYFKKAADNGHVKAMYKYALLLYREEEFDKMQEIKKYFYKALIKGHAKSMRYYAETLKKDEIPNIKLIGFYYKKSADKGDKKSMYLYGKYLEKHEKIFHNLKESIHYIKLAADHGHKKAMKDIIGIILSGTITLDNKAELAFYLKKGADNNNLKAMYRYGCMLKEGDGIPKDYEKGIEYIKNAADEGYIDAMSEYVSDIISKNGIVNYDFEHFEEESRKYQQILLDYKSDNSKVFIDENFPPFKNWKRVDEIYPAPLFRKDLIGPDYIVQGEIGDCFLISSLSRIAKQHYLVYPLFERYLPNLILGTVEDSINIKCGAVVIYFHAFGHRTPVLIDTFIPIKNGKPLFSSLSDETKSPWFCLVEKAFAKLCGSFSNIVSGMASNVIYYLFFYYSKVIHTSYLTRKSSAFQGIMKYQEKGYLIEASITNDSVDIDGLVGNHSYFLFKAREVQDQRFICLRNPWGISGFKGKYEENSPNWTPELKKLLGYDQSQSGTFYMTDEEFFKYFDSFIIIKPVHPEWYIKRYKCQLKPGSFDGVEIENQNADLSNHQTFAFQVTEEFQIGKKCHLRIVVERSKSTFYDQINNNQERSKYCLIIGRNNGHKFGANINSTSDYQCYEGALNIQTFSIDVTNNDIITIVLHRLDKQDYTENCYVSVICDYKFKLYDVDLPNQEIPYSDNPGIVFENFTISFPNISKPLMMTYWDNRFVLTFGSLTLNDNINPNKFEKLFEFANKKVGSSHLNLNDFKKVSVLIGCGSNGKIYLVEEIKTKIRYAAKILYHKISANIGFLRELTILRSIKYPSIINFKGFLEKDFIDEQFPTIITEYCHIGSLANMLYNEYFKTLENEKLKEYNLKERWTPTQKMINLIGIALGMDYLHQHKIIHRDLKFHNILLDDDLNPKICDFGDSKFVEMESDKFKTQFIGTVLFMAPEVRNGSNSYSYPVDVYSYGVMAYFIYSNQYPLDQNCKIEIEHFIDPKYHRFISDMINLDPEKRPTFSQIVDSFLNNREETWINGVDEEKIDQYLHKFGLSTKTKEKKVDFEIIKAINKEMYPENAKHPKIDIQQIIENESIPTKIRDNILISESYISANSQEEKCIDEEIVNVLFEVGQLFYLGNKESIFNIQEDYFHAIKYLKEAALCEHEVATCLLAYIFACDSKPESREYAFKIASFAADLDSVNGFYNLGIFYSFGVGVKPNVVMSAINFKIAADRGDVSSMMEYANTLMRVGEHEFDHEELKEQIKEAEKIIFQGEGKANYIYNETRLTIEALENEYVALYVSKRYFQKAMIKGNEEAEQKYLLIEKKT